MCPGAGADDRVAASWRRRPLLVPAQHLLGLEVCPCHIVGQMGSGRNPGNVARDFCACRGDIPGGLQYHLCRSCGGTSLSLIRRKHQTNPK